MSTTSLGNEVILLKTDKDDEWRDAFSRAMPQLEVRCWPEMGQPREITYALLWNPPAHLFDHLENLQVLFSIGAGVDGILKVDNRPKHVPLVRLSDQELTNGMVQYVLYSVLRLHRNMSEYADSQQNKQWGFFAQVAARDCRVGVMGLGQLGTACVKALKALDYDVIGFSRTQKNIEGIKTFNQEQLAGFLQQTQILVCLLPLTPDTRQIINKHSLARLPKGASIINVGRGGHLCEPDLIRALDSGHVSRAILDVFDIEPLPQNHPFWGHPKVTVTPHIASQTVPASAVNHIINGINRHKAGEPLEYLYNPQTGY